MKKTIITAVIVIISLLTLIVSSAKAQIFLQDFDQGENPRVEADDYTFVIGTQGSDADQYTPLGDGWLLFTAFGGAYLLKNRFRDY